MKTLTLSEKQVKRLRDILIRRSLIVEDDDLRTGYSGRGMYGETCLAVDLGSPSGMLMLGVALADFSIHEQIDPGWIEGARTDGMGYGIVVYWPRVGVDGVA